LKTPTGFFYAAAWFLCSAFFSNTIRANDASTCTIFLDDIATMGISLEESYLSFAMHQMELLNRLSGSRDGVRRILDLDLIDIEMQRVFLTNYCQQNPNGEFIDAVNLLYMEFPVAK
tara:strand:- start:27 stop:377 length:351 start_codon:yes stop_codon:yes gene_type:complete